MAIPASLPHWVLRCRPRPREPNNSMEESGTDQGNGVPPHPHLDQHDPLVRGTASTDVHLHHVLPENHLLLRSRPAGISPPGASELLLRTLDRRHVSGARMPTRHFEERSPRGVVRPHVAHPHARAQNLRAMALGRGAASLESGQSVDASLRRGQLRRIAPGSHRGVEGASDFLLGRRPRALPGALRHPVPKAAHQRNLAQGSPPRFLPLRRCPECRERGVDENHGHLRLRFASRLLHRLVSLFITHRPDQLLPGLQVSSSNPNPNLKPSPPMSGPRYTRAREKKFQFWGVWYLDFTRIHSSTSSNI
jgi:hypothetical protein